VKVLQVLTRLLFWLSRISILVVWGNFVVTPELGYFPACHCCAQYTWNCGDNPPWATGSDRFPSWSVKNNDEPRWNFITHACYQGGSPSGLCQAQMCGGQSNREITTLVLQAVDIMNPMGQGEAQLCQKNTPVGIDRDLPAFKSAGSGRFDPHEGASCAKLKAKERRRNIGAAGVGFVGPSRAGTSPNLHERGSEQQRSHSTVHAGSGCADPDWARSGTVGDRATGVWEDISCSGCNPWPEGQVRALRLCRCWSEVRSPLHLALSHPNGDFAVSFLKGDCQILCLFCGRGMYIYAMGLNLH